MRVINTLGVFAVANAMTRNFQRLADGIEMKADDAWSQSYGRNATLCRQAPHGRFTNLKVPGKLFCSQKFFTFLFFHSCGRVYDFGGNDNATR